jgi:phytoene dehydrogenase-like protein
VDNVGIEGVRSAVHQVVTAMTDVIEEHAPGFADSVLDYFVQGPDDLARANPNLVDGGVNGGTAQLHQE